MYNSIVCRYNEIATKGSNRSMFEKKLISNMQHLCEGLVPLYFVRTRGRIYIRKKGDGVFTDEEKAAVTEKLKLCFGLDSFSFCIEGEPTLEAILGMIRDHAVPFFEKLKQPGKRIQFRSRAHRGDKNFPLDSKGIEIEAATLIESLIGEDSVKVNLTDPEISIGIEIREKCSVIFFETVKGPGGLPVGSNAPVLALLSGGIDSPVACTMTMKRGCHVDYLTFHSYPYTPEGSLTKVRRLAAMLNKYQHKTTLYACNIAERQKLIRDYCDPRYRTVLYRRMMIRIATLICRKYRLDAIVTGESIGQVASQTIANMSVIDSSTPYLIVRPLCGMDKNETIAMAEAIGTFETSIEPMPDSCTVFAPDSPVIHSKLHTVEFEESKIPDMEQAVETAFQNMEIFKNETPDQFLN